MIWSDFSGKWIFKDGLKYPHQNFNSGHQTHSDEQSKCAT